MNTTRIKVNLVIPPHKPGDVVEVRCDADGLPLDFHWRRRLKDAAIDNCCEIVAEKTTKRREKPAEQTEEGK